MAGYIADIYNVTLLQHSVKYNSANPIIHTHITCALNLIFVKMGLSIVCVVLSPLKVSGLTQIEYLQPLLTMTNQQVKEVDRVTTNDVILFLLRADITLNLIISMCDDLESMTVILFKESAEIKVTETLDQKLFGVMGSNVVYSVDRKTYDTLNRLDFIKAGKRNIIIRTICETQHLKVISLTNYYKAIRQPFLSTNLVKDGTMMDLLLPSMDRLITPLSWLNWKDTRVVLNFRLLRALCIYNINGNVSLDDLYTYAVGFMYRKFVIGTTVIREHILDEQSIRSHVMLSCLLMNRINSKANIDIQVSSFLLHVKPLIGAFSGFMNGLAYNIIRTIKMTISRYWPKINFDTWLNKFSNELCDLLNTYKDNSELINLMDEVHNTSIRPLRSSLIYSPFIKDKNECSHHTNCIQHEVGPYK